MLQELINKAAAEVMRDYADNVLSSSMIAIHEDGTTERLPIQKESNSGSIRNVFIHASMFAQASGVQRYLVFIHTRWNDKEIVLAKAETPGETGLAAFFIHRQDGDPAKDVFLIEHSQHISNGHVLALAQPSNWTGGTVVLDIDDLANKLKRKKFNPARGGHAYGFLREQFSDMMDEITDPDLTEDDILKSKDRWRSITGKLWNCTDILPRSLVTDIEDLNGERLQTVTYACGARVMRGYIDNMGTLSP